MDQPRILVVEGEEGDRSLLVSTLRESGYRVLEAPDGRRGVLLARNGAPDLILLDIDPPGAGAASGGLEAFERLKEDQVLQRIPVILLGERRTDLRRLEPVLDPRVDEFLFKPVEMNELMVRVRTVLRLGGAERRLERVKSDFDFLLAQDFLNSLGAVRGGIATVLGEAELSDRNREILGQAMTAIEDHLRLLLEFSDLVRLGTGNFSLTREKQNLRALAQVACNAVEALVAEKKVRLLMQVGEEVPEVEVDAPKMSQALFHLLTSSLRSAREGGVIVLLVACPSTGEEMDGGELDGSRRKVVQVTIAAERPPAPREEPHRHPDPSDSLRHAKVADQKGLSLTLGRRIIEAHGGRIWMETPPEGGPPAICFTIPAGEVLSG